MALNPTAVNAGSTSSSSAVQPDRSRNSYLSSNPAFGLDPQSADTLYSIKVARHGSQTKREHWWDQLQNGNKNYGDEYYWDASLPVFPLSVFDAQLFIQTKFEHVRANVTPLQGNEAYLSIKNVIEEGGLSQEDEGVIVEDTDDHLHTDLKI